MSRDRSETDRSDVDAHEDQAIGKNWMHRSLTQPAALAIGASFDSQLFARFGEEWLQVPKQIPALS